MKQLAINKVEAKLLALDMDKKRIRNNLAMGISTGVTIKEEYSIIERLEQETKIYEYILGSINKELNYERHDRTI
jgi:hypothetical protein|tara:strand:- start:1724 stop:1948 length:225 start_codon:yes stop_codon:yes gene_type:complete